MIKLNNIDFTIDLLSIILWTLLLILKTAMEIANSVLGFTVILQIVTDYLIFSS